MKIVYKNRGGAAAMATLFCLVVRPACADEKAQALLKQVVAVYQAMKTLQADFSVHQKAASYPATDMTGKVKAKKPTLFFIDSSGALPARMTSDGKTVLILMKPPKAYSQMPANDQAMSLTVTAVAPLTLFFNPNKLTAPDTPTAYIGRETWNGAEYEVVEQKLGPTVMRFYIGADKIVARMVVHLEQGGQKMDVDAWLRNIRVDAPLTEADFPVTPPKGAVPFEMPTYGGKPIPVGQEAPNFTLPTPTGGEITLADTLRGKKAVIVDFWFYACATCRQAFPLLQKLYSELKDKGVELIAVDSNDDRDTIRKYLKEGAFTFPIAMDDDGAKHYGTATKYGVGLYPTTYVLDGSGKVIARFVGFKEEEMRAVLGKLGVK